MTALAELKKLVEDACVEPDLAHTFDKDAEGELFLSIWNPDEELEDKDAECDKVNDVVRQVLEAFPYPLVEEYGWENDNDGEGAFFLLLITKGVEGVDSE